MHDQVGPVMQRSRKRTFRTESAVSEVEERENWRLDGCCCCLVPLGVCLDRDRLLKKEDAVSSSSIAAED